MAPYVALATKHWKEDAIAAPFQKHLGSTLITPLIDTDQFGTFCGDIVRHEDALKTAIKKARAGMKLTGLKQGMASEGSFGPHPHIPLIPCNNELLVYIDDENGFTLYETIISEETNYAQETVSTMEEARKFARTAGFPDHGVIVRPNQVLDQSLHYKDINSWKDLEDAFHEAKMASPDNKVWMETDMRAFQNPTRMKVIGVLAQRLAKRLATPCPSCDASGWGRVRTENGLHCEYCDQPTDMIAHEISGCTSCDHEESHARGDGLEYAPQAYCNHCNP